MINLVMGIINSRGAGIQVYIPLQLLVRLNPDGQYIFPAEAWSIHIPESIFLFLICHHL